MRKSKTARIGMSLLVVLMLFVSSSSAAACICSHHQAKTETHSSCHQISHENQADQASETDKANLFASIDEACVCFTGASPFVLTKSENTKTHKNPVVLSESVKPERSSEVLQYASIDAGYFHHFYNSNYLEKLTPARAPPVL